jgi:hypothetical protein
MDALPSDADELNLEEAGEPPKLERDRFFDPWRVCANARSADESLSVLSSEPFTGRHAAMTISYGSASGSYPASCDYQWGERPADWRRGSQRRPARAAAAGEPSGRVLMKSEWLVVQNDLVMKLYAKP